MSRIGKKPIAIPAGVEVKIDGKEVTVKGAKGTLHHTVAGAIEAKVEGSEVIVTRPNDAKENRSLHGLSLIHIFSVQSTSIRTPASSSKCAPTSV